MNTFQLPLLSEDELHDERCKMALIGSQWTVAMVQAIADHVSVPAKINGRRWLGSLIWVRPIIDYDNRAEFLFSGIGVHLYINCVEFRHELSKMRGPVGWTYMVAYYRVKVMTKESFVRRVILWLRRCDCTFDNQELKALFELYLLTESQGGSV